MDREIKKMRAKLLITYPSGIIRGQRISDMPDAQIYAIYKSHRERRISMNKARINKKKQVPGQTNFLDMM